MAQENNNFTREYPRTCTSTLQKHVTMTSRTYKSRTRRPPNANISPLTLQLLRKPDIRHVHKSFQQEALVHSASDWPNPAPWTKHQEEDKYAPTREQRFIRSCQLQSLEHQAEVRNGEWQEVYVRREVIAPGVQPEGYINGCNRNLRDGYVKYIFTMALFYWFRTLL